MLPCSDFPMRDPKHAARKLGAGRTYGHTITFVEGDFFKANAELMRKSYEEFSQVSVVHGADYIEAYFKRKEAKLNRTEPSVARVNALAQQTME